MKTKMTLVLLTASVFAYGIPPAVAQPECLTGGSTGVICEETGDEYGNHSWCLARAGASAMVVCSSYYDPDNEFCTILVRPVMTCTSDEGDRTCVTAQNCAPVYIPLPDLGGHNLVGDTIEIVTGEARDGDGDGLPDAIESEMCGRAQIRNQINGPTVPGDCATSTDYDNDDDPAGQVIGIVLGAVGIVTGIAEDVYGIVDADGDFVPDALESIICGVENQNSGADGTCNGNDYEPPL